MSDSTIIDRRLNGKNRSLPNRERFIRRYKSQLKKAVSDVAGESSISDVSQPGKVKVRIPAREVTEPTWVYGQGGDVERVVPGNRDFTPGDRIPRPKGGEGQGQGNEAGQGEGEDTFTFVLSREEFLNLYFDDLELPELLKREISTVKSFKSRNAGFSKSGAPTALSVIRTMKASLMRRIAMENALSEDEDEEPDEEDVGLERTKTVVAEGREARKSQYVPFLDEVDLRYRHRIVYPEPSTNAVMFCLMDVSASMDESKKDLAKRFYTLLYLFLTRKYEEVKLVFIRHTDEAEEVSEEDFFFGKKSGGTEVYPAMELMHDIIKDRYPGSAWNVYVAQASDGDATSRDAQRSARYLAEQIMPQVRYYAYVETMPAPMFGISRASDLWEHFESLEDEFSGHFAMRKLFSRRDIYPVFRGLFEKKSAMALSGATP
ncbi:MAG TPA: YeaH/YhbH family protein [Limnobacter sp.]|uniref:YeaH/YhbH family protein n=1 Tax=Limnobacter sp. TaxID=2003368 RepID=UPI002E346B4F|nr:YeaH/YhbH family protein [Limnobacter sp.]HEX5486891.1 YeaH/YhbH family protein [Limnobacter sp.]